MYYYALLLGLGSPSQSLAYWVFAMNVLLRRDESCFFFFFLHEGYTHGRAIKTCLYKFEFRIRFGVRSDMLITIDRAESKKYVPQD